MIKGRTLKKLKQRIHKNYFSIGGLLSSTEQIISNMLPHQSMSPMVMGVTVVGGVIGVTATYYSIKKVRNIITSTQWSDFANPKWAISVMEQHIPITKNGEVVYKTNEKGEIWHASLSGDGNRILLPDSNYIIRIETCPHFWGSLVRYITKDYSYGYEYKIDHTYSLQPPPLLRIGRNGNINVVMYSNFPNTIMQQIEEAFPKEDAIYSIERTRISYNESSKYNKMMDWLKVLVKKPDKVQVATISPMPLTEKIELYRCLDHMPSKEANNTKRLIAECIQYSKKSIGMDIYNMSASVDESNSSI